MIRLKPNEPRAIDNRMREQIEAMRSDIVATLQALVRIPSITGDEARVGAFVTDYCRKMGLEVEIVEAESNRPNVIARWNCGKPGPSLLLNDHLDIVPPGPLEYWKHPPFSAAIENNRVYGRGTIDTKSGLTTILIATRAAREIGLDIAGELILVFTCDEEVGGAKGMQYLGRTGRLKADMAVVAEPTSMQLEIATKGQLRLEVTTRGKATHGARPWLGHNAIEDMVDVIEELRKLARGLEKRKHPLLGQGTLNIGQIGGGTVPNMVPNKCVLGIDRRLLPDENPDDAESEIMAILQTLKCKKEGFDASLKRIVWWPGYSVAPEEPIVRIACGAFEKVVGRKPRIAGKDASTDASWIHTLSGIPVVMFSPGNGLEAMNANENVGIDDLVTATKIMGQIIIDVLADAGDRAAGVDN